MDIREEEEQKYVFKPLSFQCFNSEKWDGTLADLRWVKPWLVPFKVPLVFALIAFGLTTIIAVVTPKFMAYIIDFGLVKKTESFWRLFSILISLVVSKILLDITYKWLVTKNGQTLTMTIRRDVMRRLHSFELNFFDRTPTGRIISRSVNDISNLSALFTSNFFTVVSDFFVITGSLVAVALISVKAFLIICATLLPLSIYMLNVSQAQMRWGRYLRGVVSRLSSHTAETINNLAVLHSSPYAPKWQRRHDKLQKIFAQLTRRNILVWGSFSSIHVLTMGITYSSVIVLSVFELRAQSISIGSFIALCSYISLIFGPFFDISEKLNTMVTSLGSVKRLKDILPAPELEAQDLRVATEKPRGDIRFENIHFGYSPENKLFENLNLVLKEGEITALVGRTGSGKTSLSQIILQLYPIESGKILWGEQDISQMPSKQRSQWMSYVAQDLFMFSDTLRENLRLYDESISDEKILNCLKNLGLSKLLGQFGEGLDTIVKPENLPLSQGEKQILLLSRALLQNPSLLIFDEATASLDQWTEALWMEEVAKLFQGRTTLFIAHRLETLKLATRIIVLDQGQVKKSFSKNFGEPVSESQLHS
jgi:ATP-binding cassette subfamily B protein